MKKRSDSLVLRAEFNSDVRKYWLLSGIWILIVSVAGIPFLPFWWILGLYFTGRYLERMECLLTERSLIVRKGIFVREEKTVPLEKITDLGMIQGPIMRYFGIEKISVETAGQSSQGALISLTGIREAAAFRDRVLEQRDHLRKSESIPSPGHGGGTESVNSLDVLVSIRDALSRIEEILADRSARGT